MPKRKIADEALDAGPVEQVADESLADETAPEPPAPEQFDFREWLSGLAPLTAQYTLLNGPTFTLQARTMDYLRENDLALEKGDPVPEDHALRFLAAHIVEPEGVTVEALEKIGDTPGYTQGITQMAILASQLSYQPSTVNPHFLRGASD